MAGRYVTGDEALAFMLGQILEVTYVKHGEYLTHELGLPPRSGSRRAKTYEALMNGPQTGHALFARGNWRPVRKERMSESEFKEHLKWMVRHAFLHVVMPCGR